MRTLAMVVIVLAGVAHAKRQPPVEVAPVVAAEVRFEAPHFSNPCGQHGGCVVAFNASTNEQLWWVQVYTTNYDLFLERDVQDVFITSLTVNGDALEVADETGRHFVVDLGTHRLRGGCSSAPGPLWFGLAALVLASLTRRGRASLTSNAH